MSTGPGDRTSDRTGATETADIEASVATLTDLHRPARRLRTFDSLIEVPAFRWYLLSMTGNWSALQMQQVARGFLAYQLTDSFAALGFVELANSVPRVILALYGGVVADRASRRVIIQAGQVVNSVLAGVLATLLFLDLLRFEHLLLAATVQGIINSFALPARQSMIPEVVGIDRLMNAYALNVFALNVMRLVAPALAGVIIAVAGAGWVFALMAVLQVSAAVALFPIPATTAATRAALAGAQLPGRRGGRGGRRMHGEGFGRASLSDIKDALSYLKAETILIWLLILQGLSSMLGLPYQRLLPGFVDEVLATNADQTAVLMGLLLTMTAIGALLGSLVIASLPNRRRGKLLIVSIVIFSLSLAAFSASTVVWVSAAVVVVLGVGQAGRQSLINILLQTRVDDAYRGRVTSIMLLEDGVESAGIFGIALLAEAIGPQLALGAVALSMLAMAVALWVTRRIRDLE